MALSRRQKLLFIFLPLLIISVVVVVVVVVVTEQSANKGNAKSAAPTSTPQGNAKSAAPTSTPQGPTPSTSPHPKLSRFSFDDISTFSAGLNSDKWLTGSKYTQSDFGNITVVDLTNNETKILVPSSILKSVNAAQGLYELSPDEKWVLLTCNYKKLFRHSYTADYVAYNVETGTIQRVSPPDRTKQIQLAIWGNKGSSLAFVQNNNIYYMSNITNEPQALTSNGEENKIFNGITDWVYEEDVYYTKQAMWFSPDDSYLGYVEFNDTEVDWFSFVHYGSYLQEYPKVIRIAYPKVGRPNPKVKVHVVDLDNVNVTPIILEPPQEFKNIDHYFTNMAWLNTTQVMIAWSNRAQSTSIFTQHDLTTQTKVENMRQDVKNGWVDMSTYLSPSPWFSKDGSFYLTKYPFDQGGKVGKFLHIAKITTGSNGSITSLTSGPWEVSDILAFDKEREIVYFSSKETSPRESHIYTLNLTNSKKSCLTCSLSWTKEGRCKYYGASFSKTALWYDLYCYGPGVPMRSRHNTQTKQVIIIDSNEHVINKLKTMMVPQRYNFQFKSGDYMIDAMEIRPPDFDPKKKYGVLFDVYGGPGSQRVTERFGISNSGWNAYLVSNFDIILVRIDGRGQKSRGEKFKHEVYLKLGEYEADDTIEAGRYMQTKPYVDKDKLAIWGWSYGGYLTTYVLSKNTGVFKVGLAVAPVTDWRYYDTAYTERYMGLLKDNMAGYNHTSLLRRASQFRNVSYLIVHGSGDDNVHYQNTAQMVKALTLAQIDFRVQYYTDKAHSIVGSLTRRHLWNLLTKFLTSKLGLPKIT